ncbi:PD-(D/E)XK nuclease-like domain-containing protein [Fibrivirga algicola]|uniref:Putative exodeoxyribonuclease 8 PDDEXK-like domain-containing protein n=1 Tax=Fibrivirga algicola TaxID=2950420 RepID=A0ABX0QBY0_9BACT|nr:PD-(D/E)XK nuclease-like domain-containing protein [Fibrivirga algicola]NID09413.1 hypothetical protein [Fibrivirga algicola]
MTYTEHQYRTELKRYANSDLSELSGKPRFNVKPETMAFGTAFHTMTLEPDKPVEGWDLLTAPQQWQLCSMWGQVMNDESIAPLLAKSEHEQVRCWDDPITGLPLKAKIDGWLDRGRYVHVIDLKTTSCRSEDEFIKTCQDYNYDRQGAFYLSSDQRAAYFSIVGVQKQPPYQVWHHRYHIDSDFIQTGMKKMRYLLALAKEEADKPNGWRPSSWSRIEQQA